MACRTAYLALSSAPTQLTQFENVVFHATPQAAALALFKGEAKRLGLSMSDSTAPRGSGYRKQRAVPGGMLYQVSRGGDTFLRWTAKIGIVQVTVVRTAAAMAPVSQIAFWRSGPFALPK